MHLRFRCHLWRHADEFAVFGVLVYTGGLHTMHYYKNRYVGKRLMKKPEKLIINVPLYLPHWRLHACLPLFWLCA